MRTGPTGLTFGPYFVRKTRDADGRVCSQYVGRGELAHAIAAFSDGADNVLDAMRALRRAADDRLDAALDELRADEARLRLWRDAYLVATGHRAHRGQWRRRRDLTRADRARWPAFLPPAAPHGAEPMATKKPKTSKTPEPIPVGAALGTPGRLSFCVPDVPEAVRVELAAALDAANATDTEKPADVSAAAGRLRAALAACGPDTLAPFLGPLALDALAGIVSGQPSVQALAVLDAERFAAGLVTPDDGPLVRAAANHAAACHLVLEATEASYGTLLSGRYQLDRADRLDRRLTSAHTRFLRALATVAALRRAEADERDRVRRAPASTPQGIADLDAFVPSAYRRPSGDSLPEPEAVELLATADGTYR